MQNSEPNEGNQQQSQQQNIQQVEPPKEREAFIADTSEYEKKSEDNDRSEKRGK
ncbi:hypothetical protein BH09BAC4_BH09BAC4_23960 [soil metagenome]